MGAYDTRVEITGTANEDRWYEQVLYNVCPVDYYDNTSIVYNTLMSKFGYQGTRRTVEPLCGTIHQDVDGTAQGRWFEKDTDVRTWQEDNQLALIHDSTTFTKGVFAVGTSISTLSSANHEFTPNHSGLINRDFDEVINDGNIYCYEAGAEYILIQMTSNTTLKIEGQNLGSCGSGPWTFTANASEFER